MTRHSIRINISLSGTGLKRLRRLTPTQRGAAVDRALTQSVQAEGTARVLDASGKPLSPCAMQRARDLVRRVRAIWIAQFPPTIRLLPRSEK